MDVHSHILTGIVPEHVIHPIILSAGQTVTGQQRRAAEGAVRHADEFRGRRRARGQPGENHARRRISEGNVDIRANPNTAGRAIVDMDNRTTAGRADIATPTDTITRGRANTDTAAIAVPDAAARAAACVPLGVTIAAPCAITASAIVHRRP